MIKLFIEEAIDDLFRLNFNVHFLLICSSQFYSVIADPNARLCLSLGKEKKRKKGTWMSS